MTGDDAKKTKQLTGIQVLKKEFTCYKIRCKSLRKRKLVFEFMKLIG